jgi:hypothetical protein
MTGLYIASLSGGGKIFSYAHLNQMSMGYFTILGMVMPLQKKEMLVQKPLNCLSECFWPEREG